MTGYSRVWSCRVCGAREESVDWPADPICDGCERRALRRVEARAVAYAGAALAQRDAAEQPTADLCARVAERLAREAR